MAAPGPSKRRASPSPGEPAEESPSPRRKSTGVRPRTGLVCCSPAIHLAKVCWLPSPAMHSAKTGPSSTVGREGGVGGVRSGGARRGSRWLPSPPLTQHLTLIHIELVVVPRATLQVQVKVQGIVKAALRVRGRFLRGYRADGETGGGPPGPTWGHRGVPFLPFPTQGAPSHPTPQLTRRWGGRGSPRST